MMGDVGFALDTDPDEVFEVGWKTGRRFSEVCRRWRGGREDGCGEEVAGVGRRKAGRRVRVGIMARVREGEDNRCVVLMVGENSTVVSAAGFLVFGQLWRGSTFFFFSLFLNNDVDDEGTR
jgi:hypothetical protein